MRFQLDLGKFESCPEYNEWLDERHAEQAGTLDILGFQPRPSVVLFSLSQDTYQAAFDDFLRQREEELKEAIVFDFPSPIAHYFYRFENGYENELQRLHLLRDTWESIVDVLHAIAIAECRALNLELTDPITFKDIFTDSVAQRLLNIERVIAQSQGRDVALQTAGIVSVATLQTMRDLNQSRNSFSHSAAQSEAQARVWIGECYEDVMSVLDDLRGLAEVQVLRHVGQLDARTLRCEVFRGHGFTKTIKTITLTDDQIKESQRFLQQGEILVSCNKRICSLRPLFYYREDSAGHTTKLCLFRKARGDAPHRRLEYEVVGDSVRWSEDRATFKQEIDELRAQCGLAPE